MGILTNKDEGLPHKYSYSQAKDLILEVNSLFKQNARDLGFKLFFHSNDLQYKDHRWKKSIVFGDITFIKKLNTVTIDIMVNLKCLYLMHQALKHFEKRLTQSMIETPQTPSEITPNDQKECCICLDKIATMMLPCYHIFCLKCIQIHIIDKQQKKCPICRKQFHEDGKSLQKKIIVVIGDELQLINDLREIIFEFLKEMNSHQVQQILQIMKGTNRNKK